MLNFVSDLAKVEGSKAHSLLQYLAVNNNPLVINISSCRSTCTARGPRPPPFNLNNLFNEHYPLVNFLKVFFRVKISEVEETVIEKWYNRWLDLLTSMLLLRPDLHWVGPLLL